VERISSIDRVGCAALAACFGGFFGVVFAAIAAAGSGAFRPITVAVSAVVFAAIGWFRGPRAGDFAGLSLAFVLDAVSAWLFVGPLDDKTPEERLSPWYFGSLLVGLAILAFWLA